MDPFLQRKSEALATISSTQPDKSPKGFLDAPIVPLINAINLHPSFFTTSSCSGRISIFSHPNADSSKTKKKKAGGGTWVYISHEKADADEVVKCVFEEAVDDGNLLVFRFEPLIIAIECENIEAAQFIVSAAISCGFRESGITSIHKRIIIAIRCSIRMEVPLGHVGSIMVSQEYVRYLVEMANSKMEANKKRTDGLLLALQSKFLSETEQIRINYDNQDGRIVKEIPQHLQAKHSFSSNTRLNDIDKVEHPDQNRGLKQVENGYGYVADKRSIDDKIIDLSSKESNKDINLLHELESGYDRQENVNGGPNPELPWTPGKPACSVAVELLKITGEPAEKIFLWGQSAGKLDINRKQIIVFGGFGGIGRHARRNYSLILDSQTGHLNEIDLVAPPSLRLGHTLTMVNGQAFIIGGRGGPTQTLNDVWVLNMPENRWLLLECSGSMFLPRHRHAAAAVGSNIYVFGGLNGEEILSSMNILDTNTFRWSAVKIQGKGPSARHSHTLVSDGTLLYMFGGYDGRNALGDFFSFDTVTCTWKKEITSGKAPFPRFSHSMFVYKDYLGIIGGCPLSQNNQVMHLLNLKDNVWMHIPINSKSRNLWVRSSTLVIDDELVIVGGGTSCYAFGTKFNEPMKINLQKIDSIYDMTYIKVNKTTMNQVDGKYSVFKVDKKHAKIAKDILKKFGWLDPSRKVQQSMDGHHILLPVVKFFCSLYEKRSITSLDTCNDFCQQEIVVNKGFTLDNVNHTDALRMLLSCGGSVQGNDNFCSKKLPKPPQKLMKEAVCILLKKNGILLKLLDQLPMRWERLGDILVLPVNSFRDPIWEPIGSELWPIVAKSLGAERLARQGRILATGTRDSTLELLIGDDSWVTHQENGIMYSFDATKCMFSSGNHSEKLRIANLDCTEEVVVDLFAGIGYFTLPFLVKANAKLVYACEWNPHAIKALRYNVDANSMKDRCIVLEGDNRVTAPKGVADRVCLGLLPSSECSRATAVKALKAKGGILHVHENVKDAEEKSWLDYLHKSISSIAQAEGLNWDVTIQHIERVKWYAPHIRHLVVDVKCQQL